MKHCLKCGHMPTLEQDDLNVYYTCKPCGNRASSYNRMSDDYAFTHAEQSWDSLMKRYAQLCETNP